MIPRGLVFLYCDYHYHTEAEPLCPWRSWQPSS